MSDIVERLRKTPHLSSLEEEAADEIERLRARNAEHEHRYDALEAMVDHYKQALSQAGDCIELAEAEQRGYVRGTKEVERLRAQVKDLIEALAEGDNRILELQGMVAKDTGTWQDLWIGERAANDRLRAALSEIAAMGHGQTPGEAFTGDDASLMHDIASRALESSLTTEPLVASEPGREKEPRFQSGPRKWKEPQRQSEPNRRKEPMR